MLFKVAAFAAAVVVVICCTGCERKMYDPSWATRPYPRELHTTATIDVQVFRNDTKLQLVNFTPRSYSNFDLWINQRYVTHVESLPAGGSIELSLWDFYDEFGDRFNAGGFFRTYSPTPVRLVQIQTEPDQPLIGLVTIRAEDVQLRSPQR